MNKIGRPQGIGGWFNRHTALFTFVVSMLGLFVSSFVSFWLGRLTDDSALAAGFDQ